jgi:ribosome biogenesis GTPase
MRALIISHQKELYYLYNLETQETVPAKARGKFRLIGTNPKVGDYVEYQMMDDNTAYIVDVEKRHNDLIRPYIANVDQALLLFSVKRPDFNPNLLDRFLAIMTFNNIPCVIIYTKWDLLNEEEQKEMLKICEYYRSIGFPYLAFSTKVPSPNDLDDIKAVIKGKISVITGQSGVGKSSLINCLAPHLNIKTAEISLALGRGKHTTRHVELIPMYDGWVADTPGFGIVDFDSMDEMDLAHSFVEFFEASSECRFNSCLHQNEPGCAVKDKIGTTILLSRYENYLLFLDEISKLRKW